MINFIKQAVESVEGIKSFLFNTDYRNNFDLQNVKFPCCVLTPIMNKKYDLNNIIRESAELQMSIVESAPYDYTGDDLYAINKRCSDLALQIIANLQVKSKLDKELAFEFILPSGDELVSGVMCNLQCTMKQGSCIGAPSYIEIVVQPIKRESITSNGKHIITPSSGFNAMREVEVDVNVPPPPLEEKQVTITKAKTTETITPDAEYGLSRVEVSTNIPLESKQITITDNGTTTIEASEGFEGIESVEVTTDVNTLQGLDFSEIYDAAQANELNQYYKDGIEYAKVIKEEFNITKPITLRSRFNKDQKLIYMPNVNISSVVDFLFAWSGSSVEYFSDNLIFPGDLNYNSTWDNCRKLKKFTKKPFRANYLYGSFRNCVNLEGVPEINTDSCTLIGATFYDCRLIKNILLTNIDNAQIGYDIFYNCLDLEILHFSKWKKTSIGLKQSSKLSPESIHYIIQNAMNVADGATARTLTLDATAKTNWQNSEYYEQDLAVLSTKGITIA